MKKYTDHIVSEEVSTFRLNDEVSRCEDIDELKKNVIPKLKSLQDQWAEKIKEILRECDCNNAEFGRRCNISRATVGNWTKGMIPKSRETFLRIGMAAGYDVERVDALLNRYGRYSGLYVKNLEDCVCLYVLNQKDCDDPVKQYEYILKRIKDKLMGLGEENVEELFTTERYQRELAGVKGEDGLEDFISRNTALFSTAYDKFYSCICAYFMANGELVITPKGNGKESGSSITSSGETAYEMSQAQGWSSSLISAVSGIKNRKWVPTRNKIISLGLHLFMESSQIDQLLKMAHMEPLCAKNVFESVIIYILESASVNGTMDPENTKDHPDALLIYAKEVVEELGLPELEFFMGELSKCMEEENMI